METDCIEDLSSPQLGSDQWDIHRHLLRLVPVWRSRSGDIAETSGVLREEAVDELDPRPSELFHQTVDLELHLQSGAVPLDPGGARGEGTPAKCGELGSNQSRFGLAANPSAYLPTIPALLARELLCLTTFTITMSPIISVSKSNEEEG